MDRYEFNRRLSVAYIFFSIAVIATGLILILKVRNEPEPEPIYLKEYGQYVRTPVESKTDAELEYYELLAELEERTMARILEYQEPTNEWYETYEDVNEMFEEVGQPDKVEEVYIDSDIDYLYRAVETEVHGGTFEGKVNVANVILNRVNSPDFPNTIKGVVTQSGQFSFNKTNVTEDTINACSYAYAFADTTNGALYFNNGKPKDSWNGNDYIMTDSVGHSFYGPSLDEISESELLEGLEENFNE